MAVTRWAAGVSGNWTNLAFWSNGVPTAADDVAIDRRGTYTVSVTSLVAASNLHLNAAGATLNEAATASIGIGGTFTLDAGTAILRGDNHMGATVQNGGLIELGSSTALGSGSYTIDSGEVRGIANVTLANGITIDGFTAWSAAHGTTLTVDPVGLHIVNTVFGLSFGTPGHDGVVEWHTPATAMLSGSYAINVAAGTLRGGDSNFGNDFLFGAFVVTVNAGATLDMNGSGGAITDLLGAGIVKNTAAATTLFADGNFGGVISGNLAINITDDLKLTGNNTYNGGTSLNSNASLTVGDGATHGTIKGDVALVSASRITFDRSDAVALTGPVHGTGNVLYMGGGTFTVNHANGYSGFTEIDYSTYSTNNAASLGSGTLELQNGALRATATMTLAQSLFLSGDHPTVAAAHGKTLTVGDSSYVIGGGMTFGAAGFDGTVVWNDGGGGSVLGEFNSAEIVAGTLKPGESGASLNQILSKLPLTVDAGAKLDLVGAPLTLLSLQGDGTVTSSLSGFGILTADGDFAGAITGKIQLDVPNDLTLTGVNTFTLGTFVASAATLMLGHGGTTGSLSGDVDVDGIFAFNRSDAVTFGGAISGAGSVRQFGSGTVTFTHANSYSGGTFITGGGTLKSMHTDAFGGAGTTVIIDDGTEVSGITQTLGYNLQLAGDATFAAAHGKTVTLDPIGGATIGDGVDHITFGTAGNDGTIIWTFNPGGGATGDYDISVNAGTLKAAGGGDFDSLFDAATRTTVAANATLDLNGSVFLDLTDLEGAGAIKNSGGFSTLQLADSNFAGSIGANIVVDIEGTVTLSGGGAFATANVDANATLHLVNTANESVTFGGKHIALILDTPAKFHGTVAGFIKTDSIDLTSVDFDGGTHFTFNPTTDILSVADGAHSADIQFADGYAQATFHIANDGHGHTSITTTLAHAPALAFEPAPYDSFVELG